MAAGNQAEAEVPKSGALLLPFRSWKFWVMAAGTIPLAFANAILVWLYAASYVICPSGLIVQVALIIHTAAFIWGIYALVRTGKEAKRRRASGVPAHPINLSFFLIMVAVISVQAPIITYAVRSIVPDISNDKWMQVANDMRKKNIGF